jgi:hypothetical protein
VVKQEAQLVTNPYGKEAVSRMLLVHLEGQSKGEFDMNNFQSRGNGDCI